MRTSLLDYVRDYSQSVDPDPNRRAAYPPFLRELSAAGMELGLSGSPPDGAIDLDELDVALAQGVRVLVLANPHNPTGRVLPRVELEAIAEPATGSSAFGR